MANYIALKPCTFAGNDFIIGDAIDDALVDTSMASFLMQIGLIARKSTGEGAQEEAAEETAEIAEEAAKNAEKQTEVDCENEDLNAETDEAYTKAQLVRMTKNELSEIGAKKGLAFTEDMTKAQMAEAIILYQSV